MTNLQALPVKIEKGVVRTMDGSPLPERANAVLVILPEASPPEAEDPFEAYPVARRSNPPPVDMDEVSDAELNRLVHEVRAELYARGR